MQQPHEHWRRLLLRTEATATAYEEAQCAPTQGGCRLCADADAIMEFDHWRLMHNAFPYDRYCTKSDMLVLKRHSDERGLTHDEREELASLKDTVLRERYDALFENLPAQ